jgi:LuxR family transcriptional regulator, maltose regulon positive regulatory protein
LQGKIILLSAPAGFGKTQLLSQWAAQSSLSVEWVALDENDNDPASWAYFITAMQTQKPGLGEAILVCLQSPQLSTIENTLTGLINEVGATPGSFL